MSDYSVDPKWKKIHASLEKKAEGEELIEPTEPVTDEPSQGQGEFALWKFTKNYPNDDIREFIESFEDPSRAKRRGQALRKSTGKDEDIILIDPDGKKIGLGTIGVEDAERSKRKRKEDLSGQYVVLQYSTMDETLTPLHEGLLNQAEAEGFMPEQREGELGEYDMAVITIKCIVEKSVS